MSTSRIPNGGYTVNDNYPKNEKCTIELDGTKLSHNYEISPVDYWERTSSQRSADENEDRIWSSKPSIHNANKYITAIHIYIPPNKSEVHKTTHDLIELSKSSPIKIIFYNNLNDFKLVNKNKSITPEDPNSVEYHIPYKSNYHEKELSHMQEIIDWLTNPTPNDFWHKKAYYHDFFRSVEADVHNLRSTKTQNAQNLLHQLSLLLRKTKTTSIKNLVINAQNIAHKLYQTKQ
jgi:hypothetical protein